MSTRLTYKPISMVDSISLQILLHASQVQVAISIYLSKHLQEKGYDSVTPAILGFISHLECGVNYGSEIARQMGVSRQMVAKTVKELCNAGYLEQKKGHGKQKEIRFTKKGKQLVSDARTLLSGLDQILCRAVKKRKIQSCISDMQAIIDILQTLNAES